MSVVSVTKEDYRWIIIEVFIQILIYFFTNIANGAFRGKYFPVSFMKDNFEAELKLSGKNVPGGGAPDSGNGRFSDKLPYDRWLSYNVLQHTANTGIYSITGSVLITLGLGVYLPSTGIAIGAILIAWKLIYTIVGRLKPLTLAILDPVNHGLHIAGLLATSILALHTASAN